MKFFWTTILIACIVSALDTDCNRVRSHLYPDSVSCTGKQECSANFACADITEDCNVYKCVSQETGCPEGFTYTSFLPKINSNPGEPGSTSEDGYYCAPDNTPDEGFHCHYDPENNFKLTINVAVQDIDKSNTRYDDRQISLISKAKFEGRDRNLTYVNIFDSTHTENQCVGVKENGLVVFRDIVESDKCKFTAGIEVDDADVLWYTKSVVVGYDDLTDTDSWGNKAIFRYGRHWHLKCRMKASDTLYVQPGAEGVRDEIKVIKDAEVDFDMKIYRDAKFETEFDGPVDIGVLSNEDQAVYVKARGEYQSEDYAFHFEKCEITRHIEDTRNTTDPEDKISELGPPVLMMSKGCLVGYNDTFIEKYFDQKDRRHDWTDSNVKTINNDQFEAFLWNATAAYGQLAKHERLFYRFKCDVVLCEIDAFKRIPEDKSAVCSLNPKCPNRYDNLFTTGRKRRSNPSSISKTDGKYGKSSVRTFTKDLYVSSSLPKCFSAVLLFISALLFH